MDLAAGYSWFSSPAPAQSLGMSCCLSFPSHRHQALCRELLHSPDTTCPVRYRLTPAPLPPQHGQGWQQPTFARAAGDTSALPAWQERSLPWAGQEGARGVHGCQLGERIWAPRQPSRLHPQQLPVQIWLLSAHPVQDQLRSPQHPPVPGSSWALLHGRHPRAPSAEARDTHSALWASPAARGRGGWLFLQTKCCAGSLTPCLLSRSP